MATIENNEQQQSSSKEELLASQLSEAKKAAREKLARLQASQETKAPWINAPKNIGDELVLGFDSADDKVDLEATAPDKFTKPTAENPNPRRPVGEFIVRTKEGYWRKIQLTRPIQCMEVLEILAKKDDGCAWINLKRVSTKNGTRVEFSEVE